MSAPVTATCPECGRVFDLTIEADANEWYYGHDCDPDYEPEELSQPITVTVRTSQVDMPDGPKWRYVVFVNDLPMTTSAAVHDTEDEALARSVSTQNCYREIHGLPALEER